jgi:hypothetical protein
MTLKCYAETRELKKRNKKRREYAEHLGVATAQK